MNTVKFVRVTNDIIKITRNKIIVLRILDLEIWLICQTRRMKPNDNYSAKRKEKQNNCLY